MEHGREGRRDGGSARRAVGGLAEQAAGERGALVEQLVEDAAQVLRGRLIAVIERPIRTRRGAS
jgi:hypothetical protein